MENQKEQPTPKKTKATDYPLFESWYKLNDWILDRSEHLPVKVRFSIAGRIANTSMDNVEMLLEAIYSKQKLQYLNRFNMNLDKLRVLFRICHDRQYISPTQYEFITKELNRNGKMCGGWIRLCKE